MKENSLSHFERRRNPDFCLISSSQASDTWIWSALNALFRPQAHHLSPCLFLLGQTCWSHLPLSSSGPCGSFYLNVRLESIFLKTELGLPTNFIWIYPVPDALDNKDTNKMTLLPSRNIQSIKNYVTHSQEFVIQRRTWYPERCRFFFLRLTFKRMKAMLFQ